jgi:hypothetical protein
MSNKYKPPEAVKSEESSLIEPMFLNKIIGQIETTFDIPTGKPTNFVNQFKLYPSEGSGTAAGAFVTGELYKISSIGTTDFTLIGATSNTVGNYFIATGAGSGTGSATRYILRLYVYSPLFNAWKYVALA